VDTAEDQPEIPVDTTSAGADAPAGEGAPEGEAAAGGEDEKEIMTGDPDLDGDGEGQGVEKIQSTVGKLAALIRQNDLTPDTTKGILASVIAALDLKSVDQEERIQLARRVKLGGKKEEDEITEGDGQDCEECDLTGLVAELK